MVKTKDEILKAIKSKLGEDTGDDTIALLEDITDTLNDYDNKTTDTEDWKTKYEENDKAWRKKYTDRFFNNDDVDDEKDEPEDKPKDEPEEKSTFEELFSTGEE